MTEQEKLSTKLQRVLSYLYFYKAKKEEAKINNSQVEIFPDQDVVSSFFSIF